MVAARQACAAGAGIQAARRPAARSSVHGKMRREAGPEGGRQCNARATFSICRLSTRPRWQRRPARAKGGQRSLRATATAASKLSPFSSASAIASARACSLAGVPEPGSPRDTRRRRTAFGSDSSSASWARVGKLAARASASAPASASKPRARLASRSREEAALATSKIWQGCKGVSARGWVRGRWCEGVGARAWVLGAGQAEGLASRGAGKQSLRIQVQLPWRRSEEAGKSLRGGRALSIWLATGVRLRARAVLKSAGRPVAAGRSPRAWPAAPG
jgi:hypothetical protein